VIWLLALHGVVGLLLFPTSRNLGRRGFLIAAAAPTATLVWLATRLGGVLDGRATSQSFGWVPDLGIGIDLRLDGFAALMTLLISGIGLAVAIYSASYFKPDAPGLGRNAGLLTIFAAAMLCVVWADNLLVLYAGWEITSITSYLLIGNDHLKPRARAAALHALLVTSLGGLAMLGGFVFIGQAAGTYRLSAILAAPPSGRLVTAGLVLVLVGAFTKSAQYPFHSWLPGAMAAPTPVSAYLHSATMVKAGVYLVARLAPAFAAVSFWRPLVLAVGLTTMIVGGLRALRQTDLKLLLAFSTVSQLGFLIVLFGFGDPGSTASGCLMLVAHAVFKAALFMSVGAVDRLAGTRDLREIPALDRRWLPFGVATAIAGASMAGIPLAFGFIGKEAAFQAMADSSIGGRSIAHAGVVVGSALTVAYTLRFLWGMFGPSLRARRPPRSEPTADVHRPGAGFFAPIAALATVTLVFGALPITADRLHAAAAASLAPVHWSHLALWHGPNLALALSAVALGVGALLFVGRRATEPVLAVGARLPSGLDGYTAVLRWTNSASTRITGVIQNGSLPTYAGVTIVTAAVVPGTVLIASAEWPGWPRAVGTWGQVPVVIAILGAAVAAAYVRRRFSAALFLGTAGYGMAALFVVQGAPDLALTQVAIETLSTVLFVLVLRRLPDRFERRATVRRRVVRVIISLAIGTMVFFFAIISRGARESTDVSNAMIEQSLPEAHGRNVVNVILVDIRGFDTMGEITVLASAGIGAVALARAGRRRTPPTALTPLTDAGDP
jgi:multicomponent Na+:H+ antiporter subunit A